MKQRIGYIDLAKGICILLVVLDHIADCGYFNNGNYPLNEIFEQLRMPLYFILSGLFFKDYAGGMRELILRKANKILIPYLFFMVLYVGANKALRMLFDLPTGELWAPLWFLLCLFWMNVLFAGTYYGVRRLCRNRMAAEVWLGACTMAMGIGGYCAGQLPLRLGTALTCLPFLWAGYLLNCKLNLLQRRPHRAGALCTGVLLVAALHPMYAGENYFFVNSYAAPLPLVYLSGLLGALGVLLLSYAIGRLPVISYIGRYSIIVLCTHLAVTKTVVAGIAHLPFRHALQFAGNNVRSLAVLLLTLAACIVCCWFGKRYLPRVTAQKDFIRLPSFHKE